MLNSSLPPPSSSKANPSGGKGKRPATATAEAPEKPDSAKGWAPRLTGFYYALDDPPSDHP
ncbi:hypothetical protein PtA15_3A896 [Puccinia triticina]|uniref:Uncharacterized protein n=1 Tax=Puccinia triticina TaxID=208348 RepID=A0ABY7CI73_9BASI|nr:uncharacterized protein PtA15_3A896 [Puccinia triticina]WAQ83525.1 hypothetical protein PtA15_3A896 [Puccinia triticina]WAR54354.1 hypothetical protein PtB15_3B868 [Puccinia triticina]